MMFGLKILLLEVVRIEVVEKKMGKLFFFFFSFGFFFFFCGFGCGFCWWFWWLEVVVEYFELYC